MPDEWWMEGGVGCSKGAEQCIVSAGLSDKLQAEG